MVVVRSRTVSNCDRWRNIGRELRQLRLDPVDGVDDIGAGLLKHRQKDRGIIIVIGGRSSIGRRGNGLADVAHPDRGAIAVGEHDVIELFCLGDLVVGCDREAHFARVECAFGGVGRGVGEDGPYVLERQPARGELCRIDLNTDRRLLLTAERHLGDTRYLRDLLGEKIVGIFVDAGERDRIGARREDEDGGIGRVQLPVGRRRRSSIAARSCLRH